MTGIPPLKTQLVRHLAGVRAGAWVRMIEMETNRDRDGSAMFRARTGGPAKGAVITARLRELRQDGHVEQRGEAGAIEFRCLADDAKRWETRKSGKSVRSGRSPDRPESARSGAAAEAGSPRISDHGLTAKAPRTPRGTERNGQALLCDVSRRG